MTHYVNQFGLMLQHKGRLRTTKEKYLKGRKKKHLEKNIKKIKEMFPYIAKFGRKEKILVQDSSLLLFQMRL